MPVSLYRGDCREVLRDLPDNSVDAVVTDPPYELGFMGKSWDAAGIAYDVEMWREVLRVLKPGGHLLSFGGTRTYHRMACAIEDAGFEIRDQIQWLYGSGFPKSYNISKGIDKQAGAEREVVGRSNRTIANNPKPTDYLGTSTFAETAEGREASKYITAPATPEAKEWDGWGSAMKPANEPVCLARKPLSEKTIVENVLKWGTGGINIDDCRIELNGEIVPINVLEDWSGFGELKQPDYKPTQNTQGRFPANVILDEEAGRMLDEQSGVRKSGAMSKEHNVGITGEDGNMPNHGIYGKYKARPFPREVEASKGGASRFFYCAKSSRSERNAGLEGMPNVDGGHYRQDEWSRNNMGNKPDAEREPVKNNHPTVKPISLMRYLCRLITPPNGIVLDPFMGSGTTGCAAVLEGFDFIGIEQDAEYIEIAKRRIEHWQTQFTIELQPSLI